MKFAREKDVFALATLGSQQPGKYSRAARREESCFTVQFFGVAGSGLGPEPLGTVRAGMRSDRREREVCPCPLISSPKANSQEGGRLVRLREERRAERSAGASVEEGSNRK